jgi:signal recognition particle receptor subunit beta
MNSQDNLTYDPSRYADILIVGPSSSGKTTFVASMNELEPPPQEDGIHVNMDVGKIGLGEDSAVYLLYVPHYYTALQMLQEVIMGVVILCDSTQPDLFGEVQQMVETSQQCTTVPIVLAANKQDLPSALSIGDIRAEMRLPAEIPVVPCIATDKKSVSKVLIALLYKVLEQMEQAKPVPDS